MENLHIGIQLFSLRNDLEKDFEGTLRKVKELGYDCVEFAGLYGRTPSEVKALCEEIGLIPISSHTSIDDYINNPNLISEFKELGCKYIAIAHPGRFREFDKMLDEYVSYIKKFAKDCADAGIQLCYHNHDMELDFVNGERVFDTILKEVDLLQPEFDVCWVNVSGLDTPQYIRKYSGRVEIIHLKDYVGSRNNNMYELIGVDKEKQAHDATKFEFRPLGQGVQNFPPIIEAAKDAGAKWFIFEMDWSADIPAIECARMSIEYLKEIL